jgi:hypothetical protein
MPTLYCFTIDNEYDIGAKIAEWKADFESKYGVFVWQVYGQTGRHPIGRVATIVESASTMEPGALVAKAEYVKGIAHAFWRKEDQSLSVDLLRLADIIARCARVDTFVTPE